jgi:tRNA uridine 5-carboxymethylaminomethyl modification enzyme
MKTGTPVRIDGRSVHFEERKNNRRKRLSQIFIFGFQTQPLKQRHCWILLYREKTHDILRNGLVDSPRYNGQFKA